MGETFPTLEELPCVVELQKLNFVFPLSRVSFWARGVIELLKQGPPETKKVRTPTVMGVTYVPFLRHEGASIA